MEEALDLSSDSILNNNKSSQNYIRVIKSRRVIWARHVLHRCEAKDMQGVFWCGHLREKDHLEELGLEGKIILKWIFKKYDGWNELD